MAKQNGFPASNERVRQFDVKAAETFTLGALVVLDGSEELTECGADPASILGMVLHSEDVDPLDTTKALVALAEEGRTFWMPGDDDPTAADVNQSYGVAVDGDGIWHVDGTEAVNTRVYVHAVDLDRKLYEVSVLAANRQVAP